jgi:HAD superfamily hydrolase (TIGR01509 family)
MRPSRGGAILFDWGDTLVRIPGMIYSRDAHMACMREVFYESPDGWRGPRRRDGSVIPWEQFRDVYEEVSMRYIARSFETGREHRFEDRFAETLERLDAERIPADDERLGELVIHLSRLILDAAELLDGASETLPALASRFRLGIVSNYPFAPLVAQSLERFGLREHFDAVVVSGEIGWCKPYPHPFREAMRLLEADPRDTLFVSDDLRNDLKGAKALGMTTAWYAPGRAPLAHPDIDLQIADLRDLLDWLRRAAAE